MEQLVLKVKEKFNRWKTIEYKEFKIFTGYTDKNNKKIYTGDSFEYIEKDKTRHKGVVNFSIENGAKITWTTWHPFRTDIKYWFEVQKDCIEVIEDK